MARKSPTLKSVVTLKHDEAKRKNIPTAEHQSVLKQDDAGARTVKYQPKRSSTRRAWVSSGMPSSIPLIR